MYNAPPTQYYNDTSEDDTVSTMQGRITIKNNRNMKCDLL